MEVFTENRWQTVTTVNNNSMRERNHKFDSTNGDDTRITAKVIWSAPSAKIAEIRAALEN